MTATVRSSVAGLAAMRARLRDVPDELVAAAGAGLAAVAEAAAETARASLLRGPGLSAPGDPPADPDGRLSASIAAVRGPGPGRTSASIAVAAPEASFLEYGTARMAARPFLRPAARAAARGAGALLAAALQKGLRP